MNNREAKRDGVKQAYTAIAELPYNEPPFPTGRGLAENLGYPPDLLDTLPDVSVEAFCGVSNVSVFAEIPEGSTVLDLGAGAGLDTLIAAKRTGKSGKVIAIDFSEAMLARARQAISEAQATNVEAQLADAETLPIADASVDVVIVNGIFNLNPYRERIFCELGRVVRPGGLVFAAELILSTAFTQEQRSDNTNWFSWIAGAKGSVAFLNEFKSAGFGDATLIRTLRNARTFNPKVVVAEVRAKRDITPYAAIEKRVLEGNTMAASCPITLDTTRLKDEVSTIYSQVATDPDGDFHFHRGPGYAAEYLGYDRSELAALPDVSTACFAGVGNPHSIGPIETGETVLDIGCGAGMDLLLAAKRVGSSGHAIGIDMTAAMRERALGSARSAGISHVEVRAGDAEALPVGDASVDVVISNGVLNLVPDKRKAYSEIARVLRPGGRLHLADIAVEVPLDEDIRNDIDLWTGWIAGALSETEMVHLFHEVGLTDVRIVDRFDCFRGTSKEDVAAEFAVRGVNLFARRLGAWNCVAHSGD